MEDNAEVVEAVAELDDLDTRRTMKKPAILVGRQGIMPGLALRKVAQRPKRLQDE